MVEEYPGKSMVDAVVNVVARLLVPDGLSDDLCDERAGIRDQETPRFGEDFNIF